MNSRRSRLELLSMRNTCFVDIAGLWLSTPQYGMAERARPLQTSSATLCVAAARGFLATFGGRPGVSTMRKSPGIDRRRFIAAAAAGLTVAAPRRSFAQAWPA